MSHTAPPALSVILVATDDYALIRDAVRNLARQREVPFELLIAAPRALAPSLAAMRSTDLAAFDRWRHVVIPDGTSFDDARAAAVREATTRIVAFTEDHSFPQPGWAEALAAAFEDGVSVVGPVVENANPDSIVSRGNFLLEYGEWMPPGRRNGHTHLPGHNSAYRRDVLLGFDGRLTTLFQAESVMHWELGARGERLVQEPRAVTRHVNFSRFRPSVELRYHLGRQFAARRALTWSIAKRLAYAAAFPLIALVRVGRVARLALRSSDPVGVVTALPMVALMVTVSSIGEAVGNLTRQAGSSAVFLSDIEHDRRRFLRDADVAHAYEQT
jgi:hypothetical protein